MSAEYGSLSLEEFAENQKIEYRMTVFVNGRETLSVFGDDLEDVAEQKPELDNAIDEQIADQYAEAQEAFEASTYNREDM